EGPSNPGLVSIPAEVAHDFPHGQTGPADLRCPTARLVGEINAGTSLHAQRLVEQLLRDVRHGSPAAGCGGFELAAQRLPEPHRGQHPRLGAARLRLTSALTRAFGTQPLSAGQAWRHDLNVIRRRREYAERAQGHPSLWWERDPA